MESNKVWWLPTFGFFAFLNIQVYCVLSILTHGFGDPATPRHLRSGMMIHQTGIIPHYNWLGFDKPGLPWVDFEWGFETLMYTVYQWGGLAMLTMMLYGLYGLTVVGIHRTLLKSGFSLPVTTVVTLLCGLCIIMHFNVRPPMITYLFLALFVEVWRTRTGTPLIQDWLFLPVICMFWVDLHGGWIACFLFLGLSFAGRLADMFFKQTKWDYDRVVPWFGLICACFLATLINPWGVFMPYHLLSMTLTYKSFALWDEYQVPNFSIPSLSAVILLIYMFVTVGTRLFKNAPMWNFETGLPLLLFTYFAFKAQRHAMLLVIVAAVPLARDMEFVLREHMIKGWTEFNEWLDDFQARQRSAGGDIILCFATWVIVSIIYVYSDAAKNEPEPGSSHVAKGVIDYIHDHPDEFKRTLTTTANGGPLLWLARPNFRVGFDDRGDLYGDDEVFAMIHMEYVEGDWRKTLAKGHYDSAIIDAILPLAHVLQYEPGWKLVYPSEDEVKKFEGENNPFEATSTPSTSSTATPQSVMSSAEMAVTSQSETTKSAEATAQTSKVEDKTPPRKSDEMFIFIYKPPDKIAKN